MNNRFNLQLFAEEEQTEVEKMELTQEELEQKIQSETDRKVTKALETAKEKWEQEYSEKLEKAKREAADLAKLSEEERQKKEFEKQQQKLEEERKAFRREKLELQAEKTLIEKGFDSNMVPLVIAEDAEKTLERINLFEEAFTKAVELKVDERLKGKTPKSGSAAPTDKPFGSLSTDERAKLKKDNPNLYAQMRQEYLNK